MKISFLGAADGVTGSRHLVDIGGQRILLDCGMFQGFKLHRERNWQALPESMRHADAVLLSHAHIDHSGYLPCLVKQGFRGPVYATPATCDLTEVMLLDSAHLQEEDARRANRHGFSRHAKALPLYTHADAQRAIAALKALSMGTEKKIGDVVARFSPVGHLLGAASVSLTHRGRQNDLLMPPPAPLTHADVLLVESTYGNRVHPQDDPAAVLGRIVRDTVGRGGSVLLPAFAVGRTQALLLLLQRLRREGQISASLPIYVDSPMAQKATALYRRYAKLLRVPAIEMKRLVDGVHLVTDIQQSARLSRSRSPCIIISASGMATGGRVLGHLKAMAPDPRHHIVFPGFQVGGSRGARLIAGAREVKIFGEYVPVNASVSSLEGLSGHADSNELIAWLKNFRKPPAMTFVVHGEADASDALRLRIKDELGWNVRVPEHGETVDC
jgi:metallo-beta-lactamase family protein